MLRIVIILGVIFGAGYFTVTDYVKHGKLERWIDAHPAPARNAKIEFYWGWLLRLAHHDDMSISRYRRVITRYPDTPEAPLAWVEIIDMLEERDDREGVFREAAEFLVKYRDHPKTDYVRKKVYILQSGY